ncbi:hypothetical protein J1605_015892 [Eschrichtius robustus]|uniref:Uncharacterized protein n=1 Tax=Eschrichtius robustus TaxID=9764 RepID=A0AB34GA26_ESCRO|nr:hypothetical protein J1605_015892 [Eschrichtius robustus]
MPRSSWAREPQLLSLRVWSLCSATREATTGNPGGKTLEERRSSLDAEIDSLTSILADLECSSPYKPRPPQVDILLCVGITFRNMA